MVEKIVYWVVYKKGLSIFYAVIFFAGLFAVNFYLNNALVIVHVNSAIKSSDMSVYASSDAGSVKVGNGGFTIVSRDTKSLIVTSGDNASTQTRLEIPWYGYVLKEVTLRRDKNADKVPYLSTAAAECATYAPDINQLAYYSCDQPLSLMKYNAPQSSSWSARPLAFLRYSNDDVVPYQGGVLGISYTIGGESKLPDITFVTKNGKNTPMKAPGDIDRDTLSQTRLFTDTNNPQNNKFVLTDKYGNVYLATPVGGNVHYTKIPISTQYNSQFNDTICTIDGDWVYCLVTIRPTGDFVANGSNGVNYAKPSITEMSFSGGLQKTYTFDDMSAYDNIYLDSSKRLYAKSYKRLVYLQPQSDRLVPIELSQNVDSASADDTLYFVQSGSVFKLDSDTLDSYRIFKSSNVNVGAVYATDGNVFAIGTTSFDSSTTYAYKLNSEEDVSPGNRLIDYFPMKSAIPEMLSNDLVGNRVSIQLNVPMRLVTAGIVASKRTTVLNYLQSQGIPISRNSISFTY